MGQKNLILIPRKRTAKKSSFEKKNKKKIRFVCNGLKVKKKEKSPKMRKRGSP
jgi:hypothetical protein